MFASIANGSALASLTNGTAVAALTNNSTLAGLGGAAASVARGTAVTASVGGSTLGALISSVVSAASTVADSIQNNLQRLWRYFLKYWRPYSCFNLLLRFYDVTDGCVTTDGVDIRFATQASLRKQIEIVLQETFIFSTSILNNIRIAKPSITDADVMKAAQAAELHDFIMSLPDGYETNAGEVGGRLSGGQKQRIAIARALLCNPAILILDEATNGLDANTAAAINATIQMIAKTRTVITITHVRSAVVNADQISVLEQGHFGRAGDASRVADEGSIVCSTLAGPNTSICHVLKAVDRQSTTVDRI